MSIIDLVSFFRQSKTTKLVVRYTKLDHSKSEEEVFNNLVNFTGDQLLRAKFRPSPSVAGPRTSGAAQKSCYSVIAESHPGTDNGTVGEGSLVGCHLSGHLPVLRHQPSHSGC